MGATMYGTAIAQAIASGDLKAMKALQKEAEKHLKEWGNMPAALEALKIEIAKAEVAAKKKPPNKKG